MNPMRTAMVVLLAMSASQAWAQAANPAPQARPAPDPAGEAFKAWDKDKNAQHGLHKAKKACTKQFFLLF